jgi:hypothetical protein
VARQPGPRFDGAVKNLCARQPVTICGLLGIPITTGATALRLSENLPPVTRQIDALIAIGDDLAVHIEFQTAGEPRFARRMLDHRLRLGELAELEGRRLMQHAVVLGPGRVDNGIADEQLYFTFTTHYLRHLPVGPLLSDPRLAPFAPLGRLTNAERPTIVRQAFDLIAGVAEPSLRATLAQATVDLASIHLDTTTINATWEESAMPVPSLLQRQYDEGFETGRETGHQNACTSMAAAVLRRRFGSDDRIDAVARRLARLDPDELVDRIETASSLGDLLGDT